jgi:hypothetical protein
MLLVGVLAGRPDTAFDVMVWWAAATAAVHWVRAAAVLSRRVQPEPSC